MKIPIRKISAAWIHIVVDDLVFFRMLANHRGEQSMHVRWSGSGEDMNGTTFYRLRSDLIQLGLRPSQEDGLDLLRDIPSGSDIPFIFMTGHRGDEIDRVVGSELCVDNYLTKPLGLRELLAGVCAVLRPQKFDRSGSRDDQSRAGYSQELHPHWASRWKSGRYSLKHPSGIRVGISIIYQSGELKGEQGRHRADPHTYRGR